MALGSFLWALAGYNMSTCPEFGAACILGIQVNSGSEGSDQGKCQKLNINYLSSTSEIFVNGQDFGRDYDIYWTFQITISNKAHCEPNTASDISTTYANLWE